MSKEWDGKCYFDPGIHKKIKDAKTSIEIIVKEFGPEGAKGLCFDVSATSIRNGTPRQDGSLPRGISFRKFVSACFAINLGIEQRLKIRDFCHPKYVSYLATHYPAFIDQPAHPVSDELWQFLQQAERQPSPEPSESLNEGESSPPNPDSAQPDATTDARHADSNRLLTAVGTRKRLVALAATILVLGALLAIVIGMFSSFSGVDKSDGIEDSHLSEDLVTFETEWTSKIQVIYDKDVKAAADKADDKQQVLQSVSDAIDIRNDRLRCLQELIRSFKINRSKPSSAKLWQKTSADSLEAARADLESQAPQLLASADGSAQLIRETLEPLLEMVRIDGILGNHLEARDMCEKLLDLVPQWPDVLHELCRAELAIGKMTIRERTADEGYRHFEAALHAAKRLSQLEKATVRAHEDLVFSYVQCITVLPRLLRRSEADRLLNDELDPALKSVESLAEVKSAFDTNLSFHQQLGDMYGVLNDEGNAQRVWESGLSQIRKRQQEGQFNDEQRLRLIAFLQRLGDLYTFKRGKFQQGVDYYTECLEKLQEVTNQSPDDVDRQRDLATIHERIGVASLSLKDGQRAADHLADGITIVRRLIDRHPQHFGIKRDLCTLLMNFGDACLELGDPKKALRAYCEFHSLAEGLIKYDALDVDMQRKFAGAKQRLSDYFAGRQLDVAEKLAVESWNIFKQLADADPTNDAAQNEYAMASRKLAGKYMAQNKWKQVEEPLTESLRIRRRLVKNNPDDSAVKAGLAESLNHMGILAARMGPIADAIEYQKESLDITTKLFEADNASLEKEGNVAICDTAVADLYLASDDPVAAIPYLEHAETIHSRIADAAPNSANSQQNLWIARVKLGSAYVQAKNDALGRRWLQSAADFADTILKLNARSLFPYNHACHLCIKIKLLNSETAEPKVDHSLEIEDLAKNAVDRLKEAIDGGFRDFDSMRNDPDLLPLHGRPDFEALFPVASSESPAEQTTDPETVAVPSERYCDTETDSAASSK